MSESLLLTILSLGELALVTAGLAVFLFLRYRRMSQRLDQAQSELENSGHQQDKAEIDYSNYLQQFIQDTTDKLADSPPEQAKALQVRLAFLQAEANAQKEATNSKAYWNRLVNDLDDLLPQEALAPAEPASREGDSDEDRPILNELDDIDVQSNFDNIPILENNISEDGGVNEGGGVRKDPSLTIESANDDMERLRKIISRQHNTMDELKKSLSDKDIDIENNQELSKKLEEVEIAQAQLNMCVETLEKENERLQELIKGYEDSPQQEQLMQAQQDLEEAHERIINLEKENTLQAQQDLEEAHERIINLEKENTLQAERIEELETEISQLQATLEQRSAELSRLQSQEADLSQPSEPEEQNQDSLMKEIETLTDLITQKSEELSKLQNENSEGFDFNAELPELTAEDTPPGKAAEA